MQCIYTLSCIIYLCVYVLHHMWQYSADMCCDFKVISKKSKCINDPRKLYSTVNSNPPRCIHRRDDFTNDTSKFSWAIKVYKRKEIAYNFTKAGKLVTAKKKLQLTLDTKWKNPPPVLPPPIFFPQELKIFLICSFKACVCFVSLYIYIRQECRCPQRSEKGTGSPGTRVADSELRWALETKPRPSEESGFVSAEPSL